VFPLRARGVGVDIGMTRVRAVALKKRGRQFILTGVGLGDLPPQADDATAARTIKATLQQAGARPHDAVCAAIGGPGVVIKGLTKPPALPLAQVLGWVRYDFQQHGLLPAEEAVFDAQVLGTTAEGQMHMLAVCAPRRLMEQRLRLLQLAGVTARLVDVEPLALLNAVLMLQGDAGADTLVMLCLESDGPFLCIYHPAAGVPLVHYFQGREHGIDKMIEEIRASIGYFRSEVGMESALRCVYCAQEGVFAGLKDELQRLLTLWNTTGHPTPFNPLLELAWQRSILPAGSSMEELGPQLAQAVGLALRAL